jgi:hypothetical protein
MTKKQDGEERVYSAYTFHIAIDRQRMSELELKQVSSACLTMRLTKAVYSVIYKSQNKILVSSR